jgi:hypothetical protein
MLGKVDTRTTFAAQQVVGAGLTGLESEVRFLLP